MRYTSSVSACLENHETTFVFGANSGHVGSQTLSNAKCHRIFEHRVESNSASASTSTSISAAVAFQFEADAAAGYGKV